MGKVISVEDSVGTLGNGLSISVTAAGANLKFVAVTGADGFIGSHVVKILLGKGYMVRGTVKDLAHADFLKVLPKAAENLSLFKGELKENGCFDDVFQGCDCVFHLASPTLIEQGDMKSPEDDMIELARNGTLNVLQSCKKAGVKAVVITSSMCAATPTPNRPKVINESHWANAEVQREKGLYYSASKTLAERAAVEFLAEMSTESAFRMVRICPTFTVGPMMQPTVNSSMKRFAAICSGTQHTRIPNGSASLIDVRDTAAHHVAAYEKGLEGRFLSTTEAWPWTLIYLALKIHHPQMNCPVPLPLGTKLQPVREYSKTRMNVLGVKERSMMKVLGDAVKACEKKQLLKAGTPSFLNVGGSENTLLMKSGFPSFLNVAGFENYLRLYTSLPSYQEIAGYYDTGSGNGMFLKVDVQCVIQPNQPVIDQVQICYVIDVNTTPVVLQIPQGFLSAGQGSGEFKLDFNLPGKPSLDLTFQKSSGLVGQGTKIFVKGSINDKPISGKCYMTAVPISVFTGRYYTKDASEAVTLALGDGEKSITYSDGSLINTFNYDPIMRKFSYQVDEIENRLYMNVGAGNGIIIRCARFNKYNPSATGSSKVYFTNNNPTIAPGGSTDGADELARFAGYYPLNTAGSFVSISFTEPKYNVLVGVCIDGQNSTQYSSFSFHKDTLTFPSSPHAPIINFIPDSTVGAYAKIIKEDGSSGAMGLNSFSVTPFEAFGNRTLTGTNSSLSITASPGPSKICFKNKGVVVFDTTEYEYNPVEQLVQCDDHIVFFVYDAVRGVMCGVTSSEGTGTSLNVGCYAYP